MTALELVSSESAELPEQLDVRGNPKSGHAIAVRVLTEEIARAAVEECEAIGDWTDARQRRVGCLGAIERGDDDGTVLVCFVDAQ